MAATMRALDARPISAPSAHLLRLLLDAHQAHADALRLLGACGPAGVRVAVRRADEQLTALAALLLPAVVASEHERAIAAVDELDAYLRSFPDDDPPF